LDRLAKMLDLDRITRRKSLFDWARELGATDKNIWRLSGGINNDVYRVDTALRSYVLKSYPTVHSSNRDRMKAEIEFLQYATTVAPGFVPRLFQFDFKTRTVLMEFINGKTFQEGNALKESHVYEAIRFFEILNQDREAAKRYISMDAAEAFLKLSDHLTNIDHRTSVLTTSHLPKALVNESRQLINMLDERYKNVRKRTVDAIRKGEVKDAINLEERCISPSDFGFHNAIKTKGRILFIDFEFAGWDDPAKASLDFVLQPRIPVVAKQTILREVLTKQNNEENNRRITLLSDILRIKWLCIILSVLNPQRFSHFLSNYGTHKTTEKIKKQLHICSQFMNRIDSIQ
jgi:predicted Ser/Thr protein kinase